MSKYLNSRGYSIDTNARSIIDETNKWYTNTECSFHKRHTVNGEEYSLERMNFAKRLCADDANLVEMVDVNVGTEQTNKVINEILDKNNFVTMYRKQVEQMSANGTVGAYVRVDNADVFDDGSIKGGDIRIEYCDSLNIYPLTVINDEIIECAFTGSRTVDTKQEYILVMFTLHEGTYVAETHIFDNKGKEKKEKVQNVQLSNVKPFAIMRVAQSNNLNMRGYGYPKLWDSIASLKTLDLTMTMWNRDLEKADKIVLINESLAKRDANGELKPPSKEMKKIFVQVGSDRLPDEKSMVQEYNPTIRISEFVNSLETALSLLSMSFGFGTKKYTFENGKILSASEYIGEKQDSMQEVNKQRSESVQYIKGIIQAIAYFYELTQQGVLDASDVDVEFDDTFIEDKQSVAESLRNDALAFQNDKLMKMYFMKKYGIDEKEAEELVKRGVDDTDD